MRIVSERLRVEHRRRQDLEHTRTRNPDTHVFPYPEKPRLTDMTSRRARRAVPELRQVDKEPLEA